MAFPSPDPSPGGTAAVFGDFLDRAAAGPGLVPDGPPAGHGPALRQAAAAAAVLARCADAAAPPAGTVPLSPWDGAAAEMSAALGQAAGGLAALAGGPGPGGGTAATDALRAGLDLLRCHARPGAGPLPPGILDWERAVASAPVRAALAVVAAGHSARLGGWLAGFPRSGQPGRGAVLSAAACLLEAQASALRAEALSPVSADAVTVLRAVPATGLPPRWPADTAAGPPGCCQAVACAAVRLRGAARHAAACEAWSPAASVSAWRSTATSAAAASDLCQILLTALPGAAPGRLAAAAAAMGTARDAWKLAAGAWESLATDSPARSSAASREAAGLVTWLGRLAFADPAWEPGAAGAVGGAAGRAAAVAGPLAVAAAVHESAEALADAAAADLAGIRTAWRASRFFVPSGRGRPLFRPASALEAAAVTGAYEAAGRAALAAAAELGSVAGDLALPTRPLALARQVSAAPAAAVAHAGPRGSLEAYVSCVSSDPGLLARAAALDRAAASLAASAAATGFGPPPAAIRTPDLWAARRRLGRELTALREAAGLTRQQLAGAAYVSLSVLGRIENGQGETQPALARHLAAVAGGDGGVIAMFDGLAEATAYQQSPRPAARRHGRPPGAPARAQGR